MNKKEKLYEIFENYPNASYQECIKEITSLTEPYYNKIKSLHKKSRNKNKKGKNKDLPRNKKKRSKKSNTSISSQGKVDETLIEKSILDLYNKGKMDVNLIRLMVDYVLKIKGKSEQIDEDLDMEALKEIGLSVKDLDKIR